MARGENKAARACVLCACKRTHTYVLEYVHVVYLIEYVYSSIAIL